VNEVADFSEVIEIVSLAFPNEDACNKAHGIRGHINVIRH